MCNEVRTECSANSPLDVYAAGAASAPIHIQVKGFRIPWKASHGERNESKRKESSQWLRKWIDFEAPERRMRMTVLVLIKL